VYFTRFLSRQACASWKNRSHLDQASTQQAMEMPSK